MGTDAGTRKRQKGEGRSQRFSENLDPRTDVDYLTDGRHPGDILNTLEEVAKE